MQVETIVTEHQGRNSAKKLKKLLASQDAVTWKQCRLSESLRHVRLFTFSSRKIYIDSGTIINLSSNVGTAI